MKDVKQFDFKAHVIDLRAEGPPCRELVFEVHLENPWDHGVALLSGWTTVTFTPPGIVGASGWLFQQLHNRLAPAVVGPDEPLLGAFHIPISVPTLDAIERARLEHVSVQLRSRFLIAQVVEDEARQLLTAPREAGVRMLTSDLLGATIPRSDWINYLSIWRWAEIELFELPFDRHRESPMFRRAFELLRTADQRLRNGDYPGVLQTCRLVFESLAKDVAPEAQFAAGFKQVLNENIGGPAMRERLDRVLFSLSNMTHLARHEDRPHEDISRSDALFCLRCTLAAVSRLVGPSA